VNRNWKPAEGQNIRRRGHCRGLQGSQEASRGRRGCRLRRAGQGIPASGSCAARAAGFESGDLGGAGLEQQQGLGRRFNLPLPPVDGVDGGDECGAGGEALLDQVRPRRAASSGVAQVVRTIFACGSVSGMGGSMDSLRAGRRLTGNLWTGAGAPGAWQIAAAALPPTHFCNILLFMMLRADKLHL